MKTSLLKILSGIFLFAILVWIFYNSLNINEEKSTVIVKIIDNETENPLTGINIIVSEERTPFKIPLPGVIMKEYHIIYNVKSDSLGMAKFTMKKGNKYLIEFENKTKNKYNSIEINSIKLDNDTILEKM